MQVVEPVSAGPISSTVPPDLSESVPSSSQSHSDQASQSTAARQDDAGKVECAQYTMCAPCMLLLVTCVQMSTSHYLATQLDLWACSGLKENFCLHGNLYEKKNNFLCG